MKSVLLLRALTLINPQKTLRADLAYGPCLFISLLTLVNLLLSSKPKGLDLTYVWILALENNKIGVGLRLINQALKIGAPLTLISETDSSRLLAKFTNSNAE